MAKKNRNNNSFSRMNKVKTTPKSYGQLNDYFEFKPNDFKEPELTDEQIRMRDTPLIELYPDAILISDWKELEIHAHDSENYYLEFDYTEWRDESVPYSGWIRRKDGERDGERDGFRYLSTHCFYGGNGSQYRGSTHQLQKCGFNVIIKNWDGETI